MEFLIIENDLRKVSVYNEIGIDRIFIDLEIIGKVERQGHLNTVISSHHSIDDISKVKKIITHSKLLVRSNPIHAQSKDEINKIVNDGADIVMLPFFKTPDEVECFIQAVNKRAKTSILLETPEALARLDQILTIDGIDEVYIGLNDLHLGMKLNFMFELISGGIVDYIVSKLKTHGIPFGIGGIADLNGGKVPGSLVLAEHVRLGSSKVILSRTFANKFDDDLYQLEDEIQKIRAKESEYQWLDARQLNSLHEEFISATLNAAKTI